MGPTGRLIVHRTRKHIPPQSEGQLLLLTEELWNAKHIHLPRVGRDLSDKRDGREDGMTGITVATAWANIILLKHKGHAQWVLFYLTDEQACKDRMCDSLGHKASRGRMRVTL